MKFLGIRHVFYLEFLKSFCFFYKYLLQWFTRTSLKVLSQSLRQGFEATFDSNSDCEKSWQKIKMKKNDAKK